MNPAKVAIVNGSPHRNGNGMRMAGWLLEDLDAGADVIELYGNGVEACVGCDTCGGVDGCILEDGMRETLRRVGNTECLVLVSPVHFSSLSGPMISWISRLQVYWGSGGDGSGGTGVLLTSGGAEYGGMFEPGRKVAAAAFKTLGRKFLGMASVPNTDNGGMETTEIRERIRELSALIRAEIVS